jgi:oligosaccharyltransferase complex subunit beta
MSVKNMLEYVDRGGNILMALDSNLNENYRELAFEFGMDFDYRNTAAVDYFTHHKEKTTLASTQFTSNEFFLPNSVQNGSPVLFRGVAFRQVSEDNPLLNTILSGRGTTVSADIKDGAVENVPYAFGPKLGLVGAIQARNNARVVVAGSLDMFSNR